jgi:serine/threonine-protein kinase
VLPGAGSYSKAILAYVLARVGQAREAREILSELESLASREYVNPIGFATVHLGLGQNQAALDWMDRGYEERRGWLAYLKVHPIVDPVRGEPRFAMLVEKMGLA